MTDLPGSVTQWALSDEGSQELRDRAFYRRSVNYQQFEEMCKRAGFSTKGNPDYTIRIKTHEFVYCWVETARAEPLSSRKSWIGGGGLGGDFRQKRVELERVRGTNIWLGFLITHEERPRVWLVVNDYEEDYD